MVHEAYFNIVTLHQNINNLKSVGIIKGTVLDFWKDPSLMENRCQSDASLYDLISLINVLKSLKIQPPATCKAHFEFLFNL